MRSPDRCFPGARGIAGGRRKTGSRRLSEQDLRGGKPREGERYGRMAEGATGGKGPRCRRVPPLSSDGIFRLTGPEKMDYITLFPPIDVSRERAEGGRPG